MVKKRGKKKKHKRKTRKGLKKKNLILIITLIMFFVLVLANIYVLNFYIPKKPVLTSGSITTGSVMFEIVPNLFINITSPLNTTYNFNIGDTYTLDLNVSANFNAANWRYDLYDLRHDDWVEQNNAFVPNISFDAVRWSNLLIVYADDQDTGEVISANVTFFVYVPNSPPNLSYIPNEFYVCEGNSLSYWFNVTDVDEDGLEVRISPSDPFYVSPELISDGQNFTPIELFSGFLDKSDAGGVDAGSATYLNREISARERFTAESYIDTTFTNITVIEINNAPVIENIGVQTIEVWTIGENTTFYHETQVNDIEDGNSTDGNLNFSITIWNSTGDVVNLFNISDTGIMNFTANENSTLGVYNVSVCVNDTGIENPHPDILQECGQDGSLITVCNNFSLTITDRNRKPTIIDYWPRNLSFNESGTVEIYFNITKYDPDLTIPDAYWYVDDSFKQYDTGSSIDEFRFTFPCETSGKHIVKAEITDGLLNDSINWTIQVKSVVCPVLPGDRGGGGGGPPRCVPLWACGTWGLCQHAQSSLEYGILSGEDYRDINIACESALLDTSSCGYHLRFCRDLNACNTSFNKPPEIQSCHYTEKPSCDDGIKNCHDGECELLIDCGGPCKPCPTCSDNIKNQGEEGVDCGGPCPWKCEIEKPLTSKKEFIYGILLLLLILIIFLIIRIIKVLKARREARQ